MLLNDSPINGGTLCPKGAATYQLVVNPYRLTTVKYRAPYSDRWEERPLEWAMERIARLACVDPVEQVLGADHQRTGPKVRLEPRHERPSCPDRNPIGGPR